MSEGTRTDTKTKPGPTRLGRFELLKRLATGGMAEIFLAKEHGVKGLERAVVIKRILPHLAEQSRFVDMFLQEARIVARLSHPNVVQIFDLGEQRGTYFIAMEYVPGSSFRQLMRKAAKAKIPIPVDVCVDLMAQACAGVHAAHELRDNQGGLLGIVHRDISPHNLMVTTEGHVKLLDFGIAKATEMAMEMTRTGALKGKVHYMSPEQCRQERDLDRRSDIFALGIVLWELFTARRLFKRDSELETMNAIVTGEIWSPQEFRPEVSGELTDVVQKALATKRQDRFATADEMRVALVRAAEKSGVSPDSQRTREFVESVLGTAHTRTAIELQEALERSQSMSSLEEEEATLADRPAVLREQTPSESKSRTSETLPPLQAPGPGPGKAKAAAVFTLVVALVAGAAAGGFWWWKNRPPDVAGAPIVVGWSPIIDPVLLKKDIDPLRLYLERETGRPIEFVQAKSYEDLSEKVAADEVDFASLPPYLFLQTQKRAPDIKLLAIKLFDGSSGNDGVLLVSETSGIGSVEDLKGRTLCYSDENSTTGYVLPRAALRRHGIDPDKDLKAHRSGNHLQLLRDINRGVCDVGGTYSGAYTSASNADVSVSRMRVIEVTGRSPQDSIVAAPGTPEEDVTLLKNALMAFSPKREYGTDNLGQFEKISGFAPANDKDFDALRKALAHGADGSEAAAPPGGDDEDKADPDEDDDKKGKKSSKRKRRGKRRRR